MKRIVSILSIVCIAFTALFGAVGDNFPVDPVAAYNSNLQNKELVIPTGDLTNSVATCESGFDKSNLSGRGGYDLFFSRMGNSGNNRYWRTEAANVQITVTGDDAFVCVDDSTMRIPVDLYFFAMNQENNNSTAITARERITPGVPLTYADFGYVSHFHIYAFPTTAGMAIDQGELPIGRYTLSLTVQGTGTNAAGNTVTCVKTADFTLSYQKGVTPMDSYYLTCTLEQEVSYVNLAEFCTTSTKINTSTGANNTTDNDIQIASLTVASNIPKTIADRAKKYPSIIYSPLDAEGNAADRYYFYCLQNEAVRIPYTLAKNNKDKAHRRHIQAVRRGIPSNRYRGPTATEIFRRSRISP